MEDVAWFLGGATLPTIYYALANRSSHSATRRLQAERDTLLETIAQLEDKLKTATEQIRDAAQNKLQSDDRIQALVIHIV